MGQPIKNIVNYEKYFSKELTDLLTYIKEDLIKTFPIASIPMEMFFRFSTNLTVNFAIFCTIGIAEWKFFVMIPL